MWKYYINHKKLYKRKEFLLVDWGPMMEGLEHQTEGFAQATCIRPRGPSPRVPIATQGKSSYLFYTMWCNLVHQLYTHLLTGIGYTPVTHFVKLTCYSFKILSTTFQVSLFSSSIDWQVCPLAWTLGPPFQISCFHNSPSQSHTRTCLPAPLIPEESDSVLVWGLERTAHLILKVVPASRRWKQFKFIKGEYIHWWQCLKGPAVEVKLSSFWNLCWCLFYT